jgi:pimeloyl-ACP methyl ester carboxylesterase
MEHLTVAANNAAFHVARAGKGPPLLLLHGWPEFWLTWEPVMARLADRYTRWRRICAVLATATSPKALSAPTSMPTTCWR